MLILGRCQEVGHELRHLFRLLDLRQVRCAIDHLDARPGDPLCELLRVHRRHDAVLLAPDDQRRRADPVNALLEPFVGNRPDELSSARQRPHHLDLEVHHRLPLLRRSLRRREHHLRHRAVGVSEEHAGELVLPCREHGLRLLEGHFVYPRPQVDQVRVQVAVEAAGVLVAEFPGVLSFFENSDPVCSGVDNADPGDFAGDDFGRDRLPRAPLFAHPDFSSDAISFLLICCSR